MPTDQQLDLFAWRPACKVIAFPHDRLLGRARRIADLQRKTSHGAMDILWKRECAALDGAMELAGIPVLERDHQLDRFTDLVREEIAAADGYQDNRTGGDAA